FRGPDGEPGGRVGHRERPSRCGRRGAGARVGHEAPPRARHRARHAGGHDLRGVRGPETLRLQASRRHISRASRRNCPSPVYSPVALATKGWGTTLSPDVPGGTMLYLMLIYQDDAKMKACTPEEQAAI